MNDITWNDDLIDTRNLSEYVADYEAAKEDEDFDPDDWDERLVELDADVEMYAEDYRYGETIIREDYFTRYAEQLADDIGAIDRNCAWPLNHIDWEAAAEQLKDDYQEVTIEGVTWYYR